MEGDIRILPPARRSRFLDRFEKRETVEGISLATEREWAGAVFVRNFVQGQKPGARNDGQSAEEAQ